MLMVINAATSPSQKRYAIGLDESIYAAEWVVWARSSEVAHEVLTEYLSGHGTIGYSVYIQDSETEEGEWF